MHESRSCITPECTQSAPDGGHFCLTCLGAMADHTAKSVGFEPQYAPRLSWYREHFGFDELSPSQALDLCQMVRMRCYERTTGPVLVPGTAPRHYTEPTLTYIQAPPKTGLLPSLKARILAWNPAVRQLAFLVLAVLTAMLILSPRMLVVSKTAMAYDNGGNGQVALHNDGGAR